MKTLHITKKGTPQGDIEITLQIKGRLIAVANSGLNPTARQFIEQYKQKGAKIVETRKAVIIDLFTNKPGNTFKLGQIEIDLEEDDDVSIENKLCQFYVDMYSKAGFDVE